MTPLPLPPPKTARAADLVCAALVILAAVVALTGGVRLHVGGGRLALTSAPRLLLWALVIGALRHLLVPTPAIHRELLRRAAAWKRTAMYARLVVPDASPLDGPSAAPRGPSTRVLTVGAIGLFIVLTAAMTYPQIAHMRDAVHDPGDPLLNLWAMAWVAHQLPRAPLHLFDGNIFAPERWTLAYSETLLAPSILAVPLFWLGVSRVLVYNIVFLSGFVLSGVGMTLLVRDLTRDTVAALVAGVLFAFLPFRFDHFPQLQLQQAEWIPLALWALHRVLRDGRVRDGLWLGAAVAGQVLSCVYYGVFLGAYLVVVGGALMLTHWPTARRRLRPIAAGIVLALVLLAPAGRAYLGARTVVGERESGEIAASSATWTNYLAAAPGNRLYGWTAARYGAEQRKLFPGIAAVILAAIALWPPWSAARLVYGVGLAFAVNLTLGFNAPLYRALHAQVPIFHALRIPALAVMLVGFSLAVLGGFGFARIASRLKTARARALLAIACSAVALTEACATPMRLTPTPGAPPPVYADLLRDAGAASPVVIVDVPMLVGGDQTYMYYSTFHWQTLLNGYSGFFPPSYLRLVGTMRGFPDAASIAALRVRGARYVVVHGEMLEPDVYRRLVAAADACACGLVLVAHSRWEDSEVRLYRIGP